MRWLVLIAVLFVAGPVLAEEAKPRRNVVLLIADDLGLELGCYGDRAADTPHLDALARRGTRFTHAFANVASCSPSRSVIYTGLHTHSNGQYGLAHATHNFHTRPGIRSMPSYLKQAGYRTGIIAKNHCIPKEVYPWDEEIRSGGRNGAQMARQAEKFIQECGDRPFCLVMGYTDPHRAARGFGNDVDYPGLQKKKFDPAKLPLPNHLPDTPEVRADLADYYESVHRLDQNVGLLVATLAKLGRDRDTLVLFLSDNGMPFPGAKTTVYDAGLRLPLLIVDPTQKKAGVVSRAMVSWLDILPTVLEWASVPRPKTLQGRSLLGILDQEDPAGWDEVQASHTFHEVTMYYPMRSIRTRQYRYIRNLAHKLDFPFASDLYNSPSWQAVLQRGEKMLGKRSVEAFVRRPLEELYDVVADPAEVKNLAGDPAHAKTLEQMRARLRAWQKQTGDPWLIKYEHE
jgi:N-sulfoglucosamine sulfohydrolase